MHVVLTLGLWALVIVVGVSAIALGYRAHGRLDHKIAKSARRLLRRAWLLTAVSHTVVLALLLVNHGQLPPLTIVGLVLSFIALPLCWQAQLRLNEI